MIIMPILEIVLKVFYNFKIHIVMDGAIITIMITEVLRKQVSACIVSRKRVMSLSTRNGNTGAWTLTGGIPKKSLTMSLKRTFSAIGLRMSNAPTPISEMEALPLILGGGVQCTAFLASHRLKSLAKMKEETTLRMM